jgi:arginyl-tRNA synthetase
LKPLLEQLLLAALNQLAGGLLPEAQAVIVLERTRDARHGDFATNVALRLAKVMRTNPGALAQAIVNALPPCPLVAKAEAAGAGFINFFLTRQAYTQELASIHARGDAYGASALGRGQRVLVAFVVTNPTGQLDADHGRQAAWSASLANILATVGFEVVRECYINDAGQPGVLADIRNDLEQLGVLCDHWYSVPAVGDNNPMDDALTRQHLANRERGFGRLIDVLGADSYASVERMRAGFAALGEPDDCLEVHVIQLVRLRHDGASPQTLQAQSQRAVGNRTTRQRTTLRQLREEVGNDTCRLVFLMRSHDQPLDFDPRLARSRTHENPAHDIQYAHARAASLMKQLQARELSFDCEEGLANAAGALSGTHEKAVLESLTRYPEVLEEAAMSRAPHALVHYLRRLAQAFHSWYDTGQLIVNDAPLRNARLALSLGAQQVIRNGLTLLGVSAPESM